MFIAPPLPRTVCRAGGRRHRRIPANRTPNDRPEHAERGRAGNLPCTPRSPAHRPATRSPDHDVVGVHRAPPPERRRRTMSTVAETRSSRRVRFRADAVRAAPGAPSCTTFAQVSEPTGREPLLRTTKCAGQAVTLGSDPRRTTKHGQPVQHPA